MKSALTFWINRSRMAAFEVGPYAAAALLLPGGSLIAALVWMYRRRKIARVRP
jgi:hypothetical protein